MQHNFAKMTLHQKSVFRISGFRYHSIFVQGFLGNKQRGCLFNPGRTNLKERQGKIYSSEDLEIIFLESSQRYSKEMKNSCLVSVLLLLVVVGRSGCMGFVRFFTFEYS